MKIRGLLLKDIFELWTQCRVQLVLTGVYLLLPLYKRRHDAACDDADLCARL